MPKKVGIAGAGLMGRLVAWELIKKGFEVELFDKDEAWGTNSCGMAGAGMVCPLAESENAEPEIIALGQKSLKLWPELIATLPLPVFYENRGSIVVSHAQDKPDYLRFQQRLAKNNVGFELLNHAQLVTMEPDLKGFSQGLFLPEEAHVETWELFPALQKALTDANVLFHPRQHVKEVMSGRIVTKSATFTFDWAIDCRGLGAKEDIPKLRGVRGEMICVHAADVSLNRPIRLIHPRYPLYIVPRPDHIFLIGATSIESDQKHPLKLISALELLSAAFSVNSGFSEASIMNTSVDCRPALADNFPRIFCSEKRLRVNGLYRHGYLAGPTVAREVVNYMRGKSPAFPYLFQEAI